MPSVEVPASTKSYVPLPAISEATLNSTQELVGIAALSSVPVPTRAVRFAHVIEPSDHVDAVVYTAGPLRGGIGAHPQPQLRALDRSGQPGDREPDVGLDVGIGAGVHAQGGGGAEVRRRGGLRDVGVGRRGERRRGRARGRRRRRRRTRRKAPSDCPPRRTRAPDTCTRSTERPSYRRTSSRPRPAAAAFRCGRSRTR